MNDSQIIDDLGGTSATAELCKVKAASVSEWRQKGIPKARRQYLELLRPDIFARYNISDPLPLRGHRGQGCHSSIKDAA